MKILHVIPTYYPAIRYGGPIRSVHGLASAQRALGHDVQVFTTVVDGASNLDVSTKSNVVIDGVSVRYFEVSALRRLYHAPRMGEALRQRVGEFDVVHTHSMYLYPTWAAARAAEAAGVPLFMSPRGMLVAELIRRRNRWIKQAWIRLIDRRSLDYARGLHVTTLREASDYRELGLPARPTYCIPNGVGPPAVLDPLPCEIRARLPTRYALFLGRINWKKGLDRLLAAWRKVPDLPLLLAGNDEDGYRKNLERYAADVGILGSLQFLGEISDQYKWQLLKDATMLLLPSYSENFGNVVAESLAVGCPVIVTPEVGLARFVSDHDCGLVVEGSPDSIAEAVRHLAANTQAARALGARGQLATRQHLSWQAVARDMEAAYCGLLPEARW